MGVLLLGAAAQAAGVAQPGRQRGPQARLTLGRAVAQLTEHRIVVFSEFRRDARLRWRFGKLPRRAMHFEATVPRMLDMSDIAVGHYIGIVRGFEQGVDRRRDDGC